MYRKIEDFQRDWKYEAESTLKMLQNLTDEALNQKVTETGRSLGFLAWHLAVSISDMTEKVGLKVDAPAYDSPVPPSAAEIAEVYEKAALSVSRAVFENWKDETLEIEDNMYGETWKRGQMLYYLQMHQTHHRGQMTVLMRQAGLKVPGVYGPAQEEWAAMGMPALA
jgi:uncharacterized damage-inducible protein DinB